MAERIVIDPMTRIEGHLRIELVVDEAGEIEDAYVSGTMVRNIERILTGRDPREAWAFAQRACGVCTFVHALASVRAVEAALGVEVPPAAEHIRNLMLAQQFVHDHVMHFYHLQALDWVNPEAAAQADPGEAALLQQSMSDWQPNTKEYFAQVRDRLLALLNRPTPSLLARGPWAHPSYRLPPALNLVLMAHYLEALDWQAGATFIHLLFGGKNPHPNLVVGGVPLPIDFANQAALGPQQLDQVEANIAEMQRFVEQVYLPDLLALAPYYRDYASLGEAVGNFLTWGDFANTDGRSPGELLIPRAAVVQRDLERLLVPDPADPVQLQEWVDRSWYRYAASSEQGLHPWIGQTELAYDGPMPPYEYLNVSGKYSWLKAPRWAGRPMEVGPLARMAVLVGRGHPFARQRLADVLAQLGLPPEALFSTLGRILARGIETQLIVGLMPSMLTALRASIVNGRATTWNGSHWQTGSWPRRAQGFGAVEAPRGALGHWVVIQDDRIARYQIVAPTTWNASPRDAAGIRGPYEAALLGVRLVRREEPLEAWRIIRSFDPCLACAIH